MDSVTGELPSDMVAMFNLRNDGGEQDQSADHGRPVFLSDLYSVHLTIHEYG